MTSMCSLNGYSGLLGTILAPMCLIGDDNDVPPIRQHRVGNLASGGAEFLNSSKDHAAGRKDAVA